MINLFQYIRVVVAVLLWAGAAHATIYEVAPGGDDTNSGTTATPFKTLQKASTVVAPGDTVLVNDGSYAGFRVRTSGTETARITFKAKNKWGAKIISADPNGDPDWINVLAASYVTIDGFEVSGATRAGIGVRTLADETGADTRNNVVQNCYSHDNGLPSGGAHDGVFRASRSTSLHKTMCATIMVNTASIFLTPPITPSLVETSARTTGVVAFNSTPISIPNSMVMRMD